MENIMQLIYLLRSQFGGIYYNILLENDCLKWNVVTSLSEYNIFSIFMG